MRPAHTSRILAVSCLAAAWFVTSVGGWRDIGAVLAAQVASTLGDAAPRATSLDASVVAEGDRFGLPTQVTVRGDELLLIDRYGPAPVVALDRRTGETRWSFGRAGEGPGEFRSPVALVADDSLVTVLDAGLNRLTSLRAPPGSAGSELRGVVRLGLEAVATDLARDGGGGFVVAGFLSEGRLARIDPEGRVLGYRGVPPEVENLAPPVRAEVFQVAMRSVEPAGPLVVAHRFASRIEVWRPGGAPRLLRGPDSFGPRPGAYETRFGYLDAAVTANGVLALYSGRTRSGWPGRANYGAIVHAFDRDGRLHAVYRLDADVVSIAWSEADRTLYAIRHDPTPAVLAYRLEGRP